MKVAAALRNGGTQQQQQQQVQGGHVSPGENKKVTSREVRLDSV